MYEDKKIIKRIFLFLLIATLSSITVTVALLVEPKPSYNIILGVDELNEAINDEHTLLIDLRDEKDYEAGHIDKSINMPYIDGGARMLSYLEKKADKNYKIYLMCYFGNRSGMAFNLLKDEGYKNLNYVKFGYEAYKNSMGAKFKPVQGECPCKQYN
ncbi:MAG: rhodanese-like domain-containing protein [Catonella sp.]|uniref:rhodanese-like domain-containing protein n=1 Tax=Catonella sp. TaxID=2382125 RepID=UPI003F9ED71F